MNKKIVTNVYTTLSKANIRLHSVKLTTPSTLRLALMYKDVANEITNMNAANAFMAT